jgi:glycosyltransferase involved in cell wall biosynthesis
LSKRKLVIVSHAAGTPEIGPNLRTYYLGQELKKYYQIRVFGSAFFHKYFELPKNKYRSNHTNINDVEYFWLSSLPYRHSFAARLLNQFSFAVFLLFKAPYFRHCDAVILSSPPPFAGVTLVVLKKIFKFKFCLDIRDLWPEILGSLGGEGRSFTLFYNFTEYILKWIYLNSDSVISVKEGDLKYIQEKYSVSHEKLHYIPNGIPKTSLSNSIIKDVSIESLQIAYVGAISDYYDLDTIIEAMELSFKAGLKVQLDIFGNGKDLNRIKERIENIPNVSYCGLISKDSVLGVLTEYDFGYLGLKENIYNDHGISTNKLYDYWNIGLVIIAVLKSKRNPVTESRSGFSFENGDSLGILDLFANVSSGKISRELLTTMKKNGRRYLESNHTYDNISNDYRIILEDKT